MFATRTICFICNDWERLSTSNVTKQKKKLNMKKIASSRCFDHRTISSSSLFAISMHSNKLLFIFWDRWNQSLARYVDFYTPVPMAWCARRIWVGIEKICSRCGFCISYWMHWNYIYYFVFIHIRMFIKETHWRTKEKKSNEKREKRRRKKNWIIIKWRRRRSRDGIKQRNALQC